MKRLMLALAFVAAGLGAWAIVMTVSRPRSELAEMLAPYGGDASEAIGERIGVSLVETELIKRAVNTAVLVTEQGTKAAELGVHQSLQAGESIRVLAKNITEAAKTMSQIATSSQQQLLGMDQVASAMESIRKITNHNVNGIRQLETTARNLQHVGQTLAGLLQQQNIYPTGNP